jgi:hypothetical protein
LAMPNDPNWGALLKIRFEASHRQLLPEEGIYCRGREGRLWSTAVEKADRQHLGIENLVLIVLDGSTSVDGKWDVPDIRMRHVKRSPLPEADAQR